MLKIKLFPIKKSIFYFFLLYNTRKESEKITSDSIFWYNISIMANYKLKDILNIDNLSKFFKKHKEFFKTFHFSIKHYRHIRKTLNRFLLCRDFKENYVMFSCPCCSHFTFRPIKCKSRICPTCGKKYSEQLTNRFLKKIINKRHRHILFTLPPYTWNLFIGKYHMLSILSDKLYEVFAEYYL